MRWCTYYETAGIFYLLPHSVGVILVKGACLVRPALHASDAGFHFKVIYVNPFHLMIIRCAFCNCPEQRGDGSFFAGTAVEDKQIHDLFV
jgi:hypothetical protein